ITGGVGSMQSTGLREASLPTKGVTLAIKPAATEAEAVGNVVSKADAVEIVDEANLEDARELMLRAVRHLISQSGENKVRKANLKPMMMRMDSAFDEANYGFRTFSLFLNAFSDVILNVKDDSGGYV
ncbi:MAG TPA: OST-HTH/LOTUS domain-containing protein, partial [Nitrososphaera sp.]|nr:OST-HTH/LOTUS domain-containing protein [Nitrososphaera sp.]